MTEQDQVLAGELALGVLEGDERAAAMRRLLADRAFSAEVDWWRAELGRLFGEGREEAPSAALERRVMVALDGGRAAARWRGAALVAGALAACLLLVVLLRPVPTAPTVPPPAAARPLLVAALAGTAGEAPVTALYDGDRGRMTVLGGTATPRGKSAELWVVPADGKPRPIGLLASVDRTVLATPAAVRPALVGGSAVAISIEPLGGSTTGLPTGKIVAQGKLLDAPA